MKKTKQIIKTYFLLIVISLTTSTFMNGQCLGDNTFLGTTDNDWSKTTNWSEGCVPGGGTITGIISIIADCEVNDALNYTFGTGATLEIADDITFTNNGTGTWTIEGVSGNGTYVGDITINGALKPGYTAPPSWSCGDALVYEGKSYATVEIDGECWMAENLAYLPSVVGSGTGSESVPYYYVYDYQGTDVAAAKATSNYNTYGVLYNWPAATSACPTGWHLPSDSEWMTLEESLLMCSGYGSGCSGATGWRGTDQGSQLAGNETLWTDGALDVNGAFGSSGFDALPGGIRPTSGSFINQSYYAFFWSSSEIGSIAWYRLLGYTSPQVYRYGYDKSYGFSVRCVQD